MEKQSDNGEPTVEEGLLQTEVVKGINSSETYTLLLPNQNEGGSSFIYRGYDNNAQSVVAKRLLPHIKLVDIEGEAAVLEILSGHPHIVQYLDTAKDSNNNALIIMEYLPHNEWVSLDSHVDRNSLLTISDITAIVSQLSSTIAFLHEIEVFHRDINPSNIFFSRVNNGQPNIKLMDFGMSNYACLGPNGVLLGSYFYLAPELFSNPNLFTPQIDIYALGLTVYKLLYGLHPFNIIGRGNKKVDLVTAIKQARRAPVPQQFSKEVNNDLFNLFNIALAKDPTKRFSSADEFNQRFQMIMAKLLAV